MGVTELLFRKGEKEKSTAAGSGQGYDQNFQKGEKEKKSATCGHGYNPSNQGYTPQSMSGGDTSGLYLHARDGEGVTAT